MGDWTILVGLLALVALLLFSTLNHALHVLSRARLAEQLKKVQRESVFENFVAARPQYLLATAVLRSIFTLLLLVTVFAYFDVVGSERPGAATAGSGAVALGFVLVFGVAIPNAWAKYCGEWLIVRVLPLLAAVRVLCFPVTVVLAVFDPFVRRLAGVPVRDARSYADELEQEILNAVSEGERHGAVDEEEKEMIESVIELSETRVEEIMTPRTDIVALDKNTELDDVLDIVRVKGHSRIPVFDETIDVVLGVLYAKDLLRQTKDTPFRLTAIMRKVLFVPESKLVRELLREFQTQKVHIAVVLDEYGGTAGLVTIEDILEELVGEIVDEYDRAEPVELFRIDDQTIEVDARMRIDDLNDQFDIDLPEDEDYETIGGFVFSTLGKIPEVGESCGHKNIGIQVIAADPRRIVRLRLKMVPETATDTPPTD